MSYRFRQSESKVTSIVYFFHGVRVYFSFTSFIKNSIHQSNISHLLPPAKNSKAKNNKKKQHGEDNAQTYHEADRRTHTEYCVLKWAGRERERDPLIKERCVL